MNPLTYALLLASVATAVAFYFMSNPLIAIIPGVVFLIAIVWLLVQLVGASSFDPESSMRPLGEGPYVQIKCATEKDVTDQLNSILVQLFEVAEKQNWKIDREKLDATIAAAKKTSGADAVRSYSRCISFLMDQLRNQ